MTAMTAPDFEALYRSNPDPWDYERSAYEQEKYRATLDACGPGPFASALELGGSIGVFSALLAPRCQRLTTLDFAPTAVGVARRRLMSHPQVRVLLGALPDDIPAGSFDLVVASEVLYYMREPELVRTFELLRTRMAPAARLVLVHWRPEGAERPLAATAVHEAARAQPWLVPEAAVDRSDHERQSAAQYLLDVLRRR